MVYFNNCFNYLLFLSLYI